MQVGVALALGLMAGLAAAERHVAVIGAGMSGLAIAGRLARSGVRVTVLEKNDHDLAGGRLGSHVVNVPGGASCRFETGASLLLLPEVYERTFAALGLELPGALARVDPAYRVFLVDESLGARGPVNLGSSDEGALDRRLALEVEEPHAASKVASFMASARANLACGLPLFIEGDLRGGVSALPEFVRQSLRFWPLQNQADQLRALFPRSPRLRALCSFDSLYVGLSPYAAPAVFSLLAAMELEGGVYYPRAPGGFADVGKALAAGVERMEGVEVVYRAHVESIETGAAGAHHGRGTAARPHVRGVRLASGDRVPADAVVCSADLAAAEPALLTSCFSRSSYNPPPIGRTYYSTSSVTFLWAVRRRAQGAVAAAALESTGVAPGEAETDVLGHHNVFLCACPHCANDSLQRGAAEAAGAAVGARVEADPFRAAWDAVLPPDGSQGSFPCPSGVAHLYVCASCRTDPGAVSHPAHMDNLMVLVPVPALPEDLTEEELRDIVDKWVASAREAALAALCRAGCAHIREDVVAEEVIDPLAWRDRFGLRRGSVFGLSHGLRQLSVLRPGQESARVRGLFFTGASTQPGNGVPLVLISAEQVAPKVLRHLRQLP